MAAYMIDGKPYPLTIIRTRYGGVYEGGDYAAFGQDPGEIPFQAMGSDTECCIWWMLPEADGVGRGGTPDEAITDLMRRMARAVDKQEREA